MKTPVLIILLSSFWYSAFTQKLVLNNQRTGNHHALKSIKLSLIPPTGFDPLPDDKGFIRRGGVAEKGDPQIKADKFFMDFAHLRQSLDTIPDAIDKQEVSLILDGRTQFDGVWMKKLIHVDGVDYTSLTLAFGNSFFSYTIIGVFNTADPVIEQTLTVAIRTAYVDLAGYPASRASAATTRTTSSARAAASSHIDLTGTNFKLAESIGDEVTIYTLDGVFPSLASDRSFLQLKKMVALVSEPSRQSFAEQRLTSNTFYSIIGSATHQAIEVNGLPGVESVAEGKSAERGNPPVRIYQLILFDSSDNTVWSIEGISYLNDPNRITEFKKIGSTFKK